MKKSQAILLVVLGIIIIFYSLQKGIPITSSKDWFWSVCGIVAALVLLGFAIFSSNRKNN